jgi:hypothetical protein
MDKQFKSCVAALVIAVASSPVSAANDQPSILSRTQIAAIGVGMFGLRLRYCEDGRMRPLATLKIAEARALVAPYQELRVAFQNDYEDQRRDDMFALGEPYLKALKCPQLEEKLNEVVEQLHQVIADYEQSTLTK